MNWPARGGMSDGESTQAATGFFFISVLVVIALAAYTDPTNAHTYTPLNLGVHNTH